MGNYRNKKFQCGSMADLFVQLAKPNDQGFSQKINVDKFTGEYSRLKFGNGGSWCRNTGSLARAYNVSIHKNKGRIVAISLNGHKKKAVGKPIPNWIRKEYRDKRCALLDTSSPEIDHKDGRGDDPRLCDSSKVTLDDFQPLSKAANDAKRQHCKRCRQTGQRYDAKRLNFPISYYEGNETYSGTCVGCYWHDVVLFKQKAYKTKH